MKNRTHRIAACLFGLLIFSLGLSLTIRADLGLAPWDALAMGIRNGIGLSYGKVMTCISLLILAIDLLLKEKIGLGTLMDALLTGNMTDLYLNYLCLPKMDLLVWRILLFVGGLFIMALGQYFYMGSALSCGPRDCLLLALGKRFKRLPIGAVQFFIMALVLLMAFLLKGPIGLGTLLAVLFMGTTLEIVCKLLHFEPRNVQHENLLETLRRRS